MDCQLLHIYPCSFYQLHHLPTAKPTSNLSKASDAKENNEWELMQLTHKLIYTFFLIIIWEVSSIFFPKPLHQIYSKKQQQKAGFIKCIIATDKQFPEELSPNTNTAYRRGFHQSKYFQSKQFFMQLKIKSE